MTHLDEYRSGAYATLKRVRAWSTATGSARAVLTVIATYADDDGSARPPVPTIARDAGLSERTVTRGIAELEELGELVVVTRGKGRRASRYRVVVNPPNTVTVTPYPTEYGVTVTGQPRHPVTAEVTPCHPTDHRQTKTGGSPPRCARHAGMTDPPPCRACKLEREAADAAAFENASRRHVESAAEARRRAAEERANRADAATRERRLAEARAAKSSTTGTRPGTVPADRQEG